MKTTKRNEFVDNLVQAVCREHEAEFKTLAAEYAAAYPGATAEESRVIEFLVHRHWLWNCLNRVDDRIWNLELEAAGSVKAALRRGFTSRDFVHLDRYIESVSGDFHRALTRLQSLRDSRRASNPAPAAQPKPPAIDLAAMPTGRWVV